MFNNKSPGNDGLSKELQETFWEDIKYVFINSLKQAKMKGSLSISKRKVVVKLSEKKDWDKRFIENWSPISLLNVDTKYYWKPLQQNLNLFYHLLFFKSNCVCRKTVHQCKLGKNCFEKNWLWQKLYHLDKNIIKWWKSWVINGRFATQYFTLKEDARQGDHILAYLFIIALEVLFTLINSKDNINGIDLYEYSFYMPIMQMTLPFLLKT